MSAMYREPLAARVRPDDWSGIKGHGPVLNQIKTKGPHSMILYGPPGTGKTTISRIAAKSSGFPYIEMSAVNAGVKEVREVTEKAAASFSSSGKPYILFIDEIHRFSKVQQDALLHSVEDGTVVLIAATTENPGIAVTAPLLSRCSVYRLNALAQSELSEILDMAFEKDPLLKNTAVTDDAKKILIERSGGDARVLLRFAEAASHEALRKAALNPDGGELHAVITENIAASVTDSPLPYNRTGEDHYDYISALIKSMRGSDPDAAVLYLAVMIDRDEDPLFIARRLIIFAAEDIGNAWPQALPHAVSVYSALEKIGMPEGRIVLAQAVTYFAGLPKSNSAYKAVDTALEFVNKKTISVPSFLRSAPSEFHRREGAGKGYQYPHDYPESFVHADYLHPDVRRSLREAGHDFLYRPGSAGQEARLKERLERIWKRAY